MKQVFFTVFAAMALCIFASCEQANANQGGVIGSSLSSDSESILESYNIGDQVDDFSLKNVDGTMVSMADYENANGYIIVFTCNTCPYSQMYEDRIIALATKYNAKNWPVIAINPNDPAVQEGDDFKAMQERAKEKNYPFPYLVDENQTVYPKFGAAKTPHVFIVNQTDSGKVLEYAGAIDDNSRNAEEVSVNYVDEVITALEKGETPSYRTTKAIGCTIKTK